MKPILPIVLAGMLVLSGSDASSSQAGLIEVDGAIGPATADYIDRAVLLAAESGNECLIVRLDTPGGLLDSTKSIVQSIYASSVPVVVFVAPSGANAGSAGCFIALAADVAAMAPNTSIGAAHPVAFGVTGGGQNGDETMTQKLENFAVSYIEAIAEKRGRNVDWARSAVRESASITAEKALELDVIEIIASDLDDLLAKLDGSEIKGRKLETARAELVEIPMLLRERVFQALWRPEIMFILMLVAVYGIIGELSNPGVVFPGVVGAIALVLALYMGAILPVNIAGLALIALAVGLFIAEVFTPAFGALTAGGVVSFFLGALMLFDRLSPGFRLSLTMIIPATVVTAIFFVFVVGAGIRAQYLPVKTGRETLVGKNVPAQTDINANAGRVFIEGESWSAVSDTPVSAGETVEVIAVRGLCLTVKPKKGVDT